MKKNQYILQIFLFLLSCAPLALKADAYIENADDLCYEKPTSSGMFCVDGPVCSGGMSCKNSYPLRNLSNKTLKNVQAIYNENGLSGSFGSSCGVNPSGSCSSKNNVDLGPLGILGKTTTFILDNDIAPNDTSNSIWAKNFASMSCFSGKKLYATYEKNGKKYRGHIKECDAGNSDEYRPKKGIFNIVPRGQSGNIYNNLYTQVSAKPFDVNIVYDSTPKTADHTPPFTTIKTTLLVEIINLDYRSNPNDSCEDVNSQITEPIFVAANFNHNNYQTNVLTQDSNYYNFAVKNAAFRIYYFTDKYDRLIQNWSASTSSNNRHLNSISNLYSYSRFPSCSSACRSNSSSVECFSCIKEKYAKHLCSRDNFSIRPESYDIEIFDDNQTNSSTVNNISALYNYSPNSSTTPTQDIKLAAGYKYRLNINAVNHNSLNAVNGYTKQFDKNSNDAVANLLWNSPKTSTYCNDTNNKIITLDIQNGKTSNKYIKIPNVGRYRLNIIDKSWSYTDWNFSDEQRNYRNANNFKSGNDCIENSNTTQENNYKIGCNIDSNHGIVTTLSGTKLNYIDANISALAFKFDLKNITSSIGLNNSPVSNNSFVYMSNIDENSSMAYHIKGDIIAMGADDSVLSNFTSKCYAKSLKISLDTSNRALFDIEGNRVKYKLKFHDLNSSNEVIKALDINYTDTDPNNNLTFNTSETPSDGYFLKELKGKINLSLNLNYKKNISIATNPKEIFFKNYTVECKDISDCSFSANMQNIFTPKGKKLLNISIKYYYARVHALRERFVTLEGNVPVNYEVFCDVNKGCNKTLLQQQNNSKFTDDPRWFINANHTLQRDGKIISVNQKEYTQNSGAIQATNITKNNITLHYDKTYDFPYVSTMQIVPSKWLIYNKYNKNAKSNEFKVEFIKSSNSWAGKKETSSTTKKNGANATNRRIMW